MLSKSKSKQPDIYTVIRDTREQQGWIFEENQYCSGTIIKTMKTGDYTLQGFEHILTVERKKNVAEFAKNMLEKRFVAELVRMESFPLSFVVCEFTYNDIWRWPLNSGLPPQTIKKINISKYFIMKRLMDFQVQYKTKFILAGPHAKDVVSSLFKRVNESYGGKPSGKTVKTST